VRKRAQAKDKESLTVLPSWSRRMALLQDGKPCRVLLKGIAAEDLKILQGLNLLTAHPVLYVCNVAEADAATGNEHTKAVEAMAKAAGRGDRRSSPPPSKPRSLSFPTTRSRIPRRDGPRRSLASTADPRRLRLAHPHHLFHRRPEGDARLDHRQAAPRPRRRPA
jgi:hypothetical protein